MGFFSKLFGGENKSNSNTSGQVGSPATWSARFMLLSLAQTSSEDPTLEETRGILENFPNCPSSELNSIYTYVVNAHKKAGHSDGEWDRIWEEFSAQLKTFKLSETFTAMKEVANVYWLLKKEESMEDVVEIFTYRMAQCEKYLQISKSDYRAILEEAKENIG